MPLNFSRTSIHHGAGEDGHDSGVRIKYSLLHDGVMLFDPHVQGHIVVLGESSQRVQQQNWVLGGQGVFRFWKSFSRIEGLDV